MKRSALVALVLTALAIVGIVVYLAKPRHEEFDDVRLRDTVDPSKPPATSPPPVVGTCVSSMKDPKQTIVSLDARHLAATSLASKNRSAAALAEMRNIADTDPGYPGINLDISRVLLRSRNAAEANDAVKVQLGISECLSKLSESDTQAYCKSQWTSITPEGCRSELARIHNQAEHQAEMVRIELANVPDVRALQPNAPNSVAKRANDNPPSNVPIPSTPQPAPGGQTGSPAVSRADNQPAPPPLPTPVVLKTSEAFAHVGERATVCGVVVSKQYVPEANGKPTFINLDRSFPNTTFTVVVWGNDLDQTGDLPEKGDLCVTGTVVMYRGIPEIIVHNSKDWSHGGRP